MVDGTPIPGSGVIGWGFNIFDAYSSRSKTRQLFAFPAEEKVWEYPATGITYSYGGNIVPEDVSLGESVGQAYKERREFESSFAAKADIEATSGVFSGQFEASYSNASRSSDDYVFSIYIEEWCSWRLTVQNASIDNLKVDVKNDPDFNSLPDKFDSSNQILFFRFFDKYGTHYVSSVDVGYRLYYSCAVDRSYSQNTTEVEAKLSLEFKALFGKGGATAQTEWQKVGTKWTESRVAKAATVGGDASLLGIVEPSYGENFEAELNSWKSAAMNAPAAIGFKLKPMMDLFTGAKRDAVQDAFYAYASSHVYLESRTSSSLILIHGKPVVVETPFPAESSGFQVCILDRKTLEIVVSRYFTFGWPKWWTDWEDVYSDMWSVLRNYDDDNVLVAIVARGMTLQWPPTEFIYGYMMGLGASRLTTWYEEGQGSVTPVALNYALIGVPGRGVGNGFDALTMGTGGVYPVQSDGKWVLPGPAGPVASLTASVRQLQAGTANEIALVSLRSDAAIPRD